jgi:hypothetical protein
VRMVYRLGADVSEQRVSKSWLTDESSGLPGSNQEPARGDNMISERRIVILKRVTADGGDRRRPPIPQ